LLKPVSNSVVASLVGACGASSAAIDLYTQRVPNLLTFGIATFGLTFAVVRLSPHSVWSALGGLALGLVLMLPGHLIGATGAGDVKLLAALGTLLGPKGIALAFVFTAIAGGVLAVVVAMQRRLLAETIFRTATFVRTGGANVGEIEHAASHNRFAYAPAIAIGALVAALVA
jgi:prepilin peptidase CpaA